MILKILSLIGMVLSIPIGLYVWFVWGWYDGIVMVFNSVMNDPKSASDFAFGLLRIVLGNLLGGIAFVIVFWFSLVLGLISDDLPTIRRIRRRK